MSEKNACVSIFSDANALKQALQQLQRQGMEMQRVSVIGCNQYVQTMNFFTSQHSEIIETDKFGRLFIAGSILHEFNAQMNNTVFEQAMNRVARALFKTGISRQCIADYEATLQQGDFLLIVHGPRQLVELACDILHCDSQQVTVHIA